MRNMLRFYGGWDMYYSYLQVAKNVPDEERTQEQKELLDFHHNDTPTYNQLFNRS